MCFFKNLPTKPVIPTGFSKVDPQHHEDSSELCTSIELNVQPAQKQASSLTFQQHWMLMNCLGMIQDGSRMMADMDQKLEKAERCLEQGKRAVSDLKEEDTCGPKRLSSSGLNCQENADQNLFKSNDKLTAKLFGSCQYKYKLILDGDFSTTLYKERNFSLEVKLIEIESGKEVLNGNMINICLALCEDNGEWISETKEGLAFLKGKIETELYHGCASFVKMAARDVSRGFANKSVNVAVYPKPTVLKYSGESSIEENIDFSLIEPLIVHGVCVKAKKRD